MFLLAVMLLLTKDCQLSSAVAKLSAPRNVSVVSLNMGAVVEWSSTDNPQRDVTYTARYVTKRTTQSMCLNTKDLKCDAGKLNIFAAHTFQVRAENRYLGIFSAWVNTTEFVPYKHTVIGPPAVRVIIENNVLYVHVEDPVLKMGKLTDAYSKVSYVIRHWTEGFEEQEAKIYKEDKKEEIKFAIKGLQLWSKYCAKAQVALKGFKNARLFSDPVCVNNIPVLTSCAIAAAIFLPLALVLAWLTYKGKMFLYPDTTLPDHFKKKPFPSSLLSAEAAQKAQHQMEQHDKISAISEEHVYETLGEKEKLSEDLRLVMVGDYTTLIPMKPGPRFYPNQVYSLNLKNTVFTHSHDTTNTQAYYNFQSQCDGTS